jgi:hypothetical protein
LFAVTAVLQLFAGGAKASIPNRTTAARTAAIRGAFSNQMVLPPGSHAYGDTYQNWTALWWQWFLPLTTEEFNACSVGTPDSVAFLLAGPATCSGIVPTGTPLFFPVANVECSSLESPPFFGATAPESKACAESYLPLLFAPGQTLTVVIDGTPVQNITGLLATSPDFTFTIPGPDNAFEITCGSYPCTGQSTATGYYLMLTPLPPGRHTIHIVAMGFGIDTTSLNFSGCSIIKRWPAPSNST